MKSILNGIEGKSLDEELSLALISSFFNSFSLSNSSVFDEEGVLSQLPTTLQRRVFMHRYCDIISGICLFKHNTTPTLRLFLLLLIAAGAVALIMRQSQVQVDEHGIWSEEAARLERSGELLPYTRGSIRGAMDRTLVEDREAYHVTFSYRDFRRGHPVGFSAELFSELLSLTGDEGARRLLARYPAVGIEVDDPGALMDIDTLADLHAARPA